MRVLYFEEEIRNALLRKNWFTIEEASLLSVGLSYESMDVARSAHSRNFLHGTEEYVKIDHSVQPVSASVTHGREAFNERMDDANFIFSYLHDEVFLVKAYDFGYRSEYPPILEIKPSAIDLDLESFDPINCLITKDSLAKWFYSVGELQRARMFNPSIDITQFSQKLFIEKDNACHAEEGMDEEENKYPAKINLTIAAHQHFWIEKNAGEKPTNKKVQAWIQAEASRLGITHVDSGKKMKGVSNKVETVIPGLIRPDENLN